MKSVTILIIVCLLFSGLYTSVAAIPQQNIDQSSNYPNYIKYGCNSQTGNAFIWFQSTANKSVTYQITTGWYINYPNTIKDYLNTFKNDIIILTDSPYGTCGWIDYAHIYLTAIERGEIAYQSLDKYAVRNDTILNIATKSLRDTYPTTEISLIVLFVALPIIIFVSCIIFCCRTGCCD
jgi:hypothetical protein